MQFIAQVVETYTHDSETSDYGMPLYQDKCVPT